MTILIPMDFTEVSINALQYAHALYLKDTLVCLHVAPDALDQYTPVLLKERLKEVNILKQKFEDSVLKALNIKELGERIKIRIEEGEISSAITNVAKEFNPDYIVMGRRDKYDLIDKWLGTYSLSIVKTQNYPVLVVPRFATYTGFKKVIVATDKHLADRKSIDWIKMWNEGYKAYVKFLHVSSESDQKEEKTYDEVSQRLIGSLFETEHASFGFEIEHLDGKDIVSPLLAKAYNFHADLIIALPDRQSLLLSLLVKSVSKELILESKLPVLFSRPD